MNKCIAYATDSGREFIEETQEEWPHKWDKKIMYYQVVGVCRTLNNKTVRKALNYAMTTWDLEIDIKFKPYWYEPAFQTTNLTINFKNSDEDPFFKDRPTVLAYAYFPGQGSVSGKVVFNNNYIWSLNGKSISGKEAKAKGFIEFADDASRIKTFNIITVLVHELGHSLGLKHDTHKDSRDAMDAYYDNMLGLSPWDIVRIRLKYPPRIFSRWSHYARLKKWLARKKSSL